MDKIVLFLYTNIYNGVANIPQYVLKLVCVVLFDHGMLRRTVAATVAGRRFDCFSMTKNINIK